MNKPANDGAFEQLGQIARDLHDALRKLGFEQSLSEVAREIPDARDRLAYVGQMTEAAAHKVLATVECGLPQCERMRVEGLALAERVRLATSAGPGDSQTAGVLVHCAAYAQEASAFAQRQGEFLTEIMMAQSFQDLSGQVINRVIGIITRTERQLVDLLLETAPDQVEAASPALTGPQVPGKALQQDGVDDLLASLGF